MWERVVSSVNSRASRAFKVADLGVGSSAISGEGFYTVPIGRYLNTGLYLPTYTR